MPDKLERGDFHIKKKRLGDAQFIQVLNELEPGIPAVYLSQEYGFSEGTLYTRTFKFRGMDV